MRKIFLLLIILSFSSSLLLVGCSSKKVEKETEKLLPVEVCTAEKGSINQEVDLTGEVTSDSEVSLAPKISGKVASVNVKVGQPVSKGTVLFQLESTDVKNSLNVQNASLELQKVNLEDAKRTFDRNKILFSQDAISKVEYEQAETNLKRMQAQYNQTIANIKVSEENCHSVNVIAPIDGVVSFKNVEVGEMVSPQATVIGLVNLHNLKVNVGVSENLLQYISLGEQANVKIDALNKTVKGQITAIAPQMDSKTKTFLVEVKIPNPDGKILDGMVANLKISTNKVKNAILIPTDAILNNNGQNKLFVVVNGVAKERDVKLGISNLTKTEIKSGLKENESVIFQGNRLVSDGEKVKVIKTTGTTGGGK